MNNIYKTITSLLFLLEKTDDFELKDFLREKIKSLIEENY